MNTRQPGCSWVPGPVARPALLDLVQKAMKRRNCFSMAALCRVNIYRQSILSRLLNGRLVRPKDMKSFASLLGVTIAEADAALNKRAPFSGNVHNIHSRGRSKKNVTAAAGCAATSNEAAQIVGVHNSKIKSQVAP